MITRILIVLAVFWATWACAPKAPEPALDPSRVVAVLVLERATPCIDCRYTDVYRPICSATAVVHDGRTQLLTASHCLPDGARPLSEVRYWAPSGWGYGRAVLVEDRDPVAYLDPLDPETLNPARLGRLPVEGELARSYSAVYEATSAGRVTAWLTGNWFETNQTIIAGWSGSPVVNASGEVWGVIEKCPVDLAQHCRPGATIVYAVGE